MDSKVHIIGIRNEMIKTLATLGKVLSFLNIIPLLRFFYFLYLSFKIYFLKISSIQK
jgi:hypothetical protein